jgi:hypothetical protein
MDNREFTTVESRATAVLLLQRLARGPGRVAEHELPLNKILCGWPLEAPVDPLRPPGEDWDPLCEDLLRAAIAHWSVLGETSPAGFRQTFLLREGDLIRSEKGWTVRVHPGSFDILLQSLPWALSLVPLPWLEKPIHVLWT